MSCQENHGKAVFFCNLMGSFLNLFDMRIGYEYKEIIGFLHLNYELNSDQKYNLSVVSLMFGCFLGFYPTLNSFLKVISIEEWA